MAETIIYTIFAIFAVYGIYTAAREAVLLISRLAGKSEARHGSDLCVGCRGCEGCHMADTANGEEEEYPLVPENGDDTADSKNDSFDEEDFSEHKNIDTSVL